jgi:hypothetical protein
VSEHQDNQETEEIEQVNDELTRGLKLCHSLIDDYRSKLAVNLNDLGDFQPANDDRRADDSRLA